MPLGRVKSVARSTETICENCNPDLRSSRPVDGNDIPGSIHATKDGNCMTLDFSPIHAFAC